MGDDNTVLDQVLLIDGLVMGNHQLFAYHINQGRATVERFKSDSDHGARLELLCKM